MDRPDPKSVYEEAFALAQRLALDLTATHPLVLLVAAQMVAASTVNTIDRTLAADENFSRSDLTAAYREIMDLSPPDARDSLRILHSMFTLADADAGAAAAMIAVRSMIGASANGDEALSRLLAAASIVRTAYGLDSRDTARATEIARAARAFLADKPLHITAPGGIA